MQANRYEKGKDSPFPSSLLNSKQLNTNLNNYNLTLGEA